MKSTTTWLQTAAATLSAIAVAVIPVSALANNHHDGEKSEKMNIVETAASAGQFKTLLAAATEAGLAGTLATGGPFTVFAPTDEAFSKLPDGAVESLLADKEELKRVLLYHVVNGKVPAKAAMKLNKAETLAGPAVPIKVSQGSVMVGSAKVVKGDVMASNGVIHVIDSVLLPPPADIENSITDVAAGAGQFKTLVKALGVAGLDEVLNTDKGPFTVFAPTDEAFAKLPEGTVEALIQDKEQLKKVLLYHVVKGDVPAAKVVNLKKADTLVKNQSVTISTKGDSVMINNARVVKADVRAANGVIHVIDTVLIPR